MNDAIARNMSDDELLQHAALVHVGEPFEQIVERVILIAEERESELEEVHKELAAVRDKVGDLHLNLDHTRDTLIDILDPVPSQVIKDLGDIIDKLEELI